VHYRCIISIISNLYRDLSSAGGHQHAKGQFPGGESLWLPQQGFSKQKCVASFERIGAATKDGVTRACLQDKQVMIAIRDGDEETDMFHHAVQTANKNAVHQLIQAGYDAEHLRATIVKKEQEERVTEPNTVACQVALANAKGHGGHFHVTHGAHMTCDDLFIAAEMSARQEERANNERKKKLALQLQDVEEKALAILSQEKAVQSLTVKELGVLLAWHQAPKVPGAKKADKLLQWQNIVASREAPPLFA
jgi:hypothetical protein